MDKTSDKKKNIICFDNPFLFSGWWYWIYEPNNTTFEDCISLYNNGTIGYHLLINNCGYFMRDIWDRFD